VNNNQKSKNTNRITGAAILFILLVMVLVQRTNISWIKNWWALLFLIPAFASINNIIGDGQKKKGFTFTLASNLVGILFPVAICAILMLGLTWNLVMPIIIILAGFSMFIIGFVNQSYGSGKMINSLRFWFFSWGFAVFLVGVISLSFNLGLIAPDRFLLPWYGGALLVAASGGVLSSVLEFQSAQRINALVIIHFTVFALIAIPGLLALFQ